MRLTKMLERAFDKMQMDILDPLTIFETENLLTNQCVLTKYSDANLHEIIPKIKKNSRSILK